jgi:hypothetical protein
MSFSVIASGQASSFNLTTLGLDHVQSHDKLHNAMADGTGHRFSPASEKANHFTGLEELIGSVDGTC